MRIDESLNIVMTIDRDDGSAVYVHATPISREVFQRFWKPMARAYNDLLQQQLIVTGARVAANALRDAAREAGMLDAVETGLIAEIRRLANVIVPGAASGWQMIAYDDAARSDLISQDDADEIEGVLVFFTLAWRLHPTKDRKDWISGAAAVWGARTSSLSLSAYANSLTTSTETANTGATAPALSSPLPSIGQPTPALHPVSPTGLTISPGIAA